MTSVPRPTPVPVPVEPPTPAPDATFGDRVKRLRDVAGSSVADASTAAGMDPAQWQAIEDNVSAVRFRHLWQIAGALGITLGDLLA